jgi:branched-subunit amino acid aminotransferase/4-amino-4-deoxychorismate lyase
MPRGRPRKNQGDVLVRSAEFIGWALGGLEREIIETRQRLSALTDQAARLRRRLGRRGVDGAATATAPAGDGTRAARQPRRRRRQMSAAARKRISELLKRRWAERKKAGKNRL